MDFQVDPSAPPILTGYLLDVLKFLLENIPGDAVSLTALRNKLAGQLSRSGLKTKFIELAISDARKCGWIETVPGSTPEMVRFAANGLARQQGVCAAPREAEVPRITARAKEESSSKDNIFKNKNGRWEIVYDGQEIHINGNRVGYVYA